LDLASTELVADAVAGAGEAHVAGGVDLARDRRRRGGRSRSRGPRWCSLLASTNGGRFVGRLVPARVRGDERL
jgi:hypothetical protein